MDFSSNPFADPEDVNPFADPAITSVTEPPPPAEEYNPFADQPPPPPEAVKIAPPPTKQEVKAKNKQKPSGPIAPPPSNPAVIEAQYQPPPFTQPPEEEPKDEMQRREKEIEEREAALQERERNLQRLGPQRRENNFPPLPKGCPIKPCFYHDISVEIPPSQRLIVRALLGLWIYTIVLLALNLIVSIAGAGVGGTDHNSDYLVTMGFAIAFFVLFVPGSMICWYIPVYRAYRSDNKVWGYVIYYIHCRSDSSLAYMWFFFVFCFQIISYVFNACGFPRTGGCGFWNGAIIFDESTAVGAMFMITAILWALAAPIAVIVFLRVHRYYRSSGASLKKAQEEAYAAAASNKTLQKAGKQAVYAAATNKTVQQGVAQGVRSAAQSAVAQQN